MQVVFLDVDGVLNSESYVLKLEAQHRALGHTEPPRPKRDTTCDCFKLYHQIDRDAIARLNRIVAATGAKIVVSSTWRKLFDLPDLRRILEEHGLVGEIIGATPDGHDEPGLRAAYDHPERLCRGYEIDFWLRQHPEVERFVILDDGADMVMHVNRLVQTDCQEGLLDDHVDLAIRIMAWDGKTVPSPMDEMDDGMEVARNRYEEYTDPTTGELLYKLRDLSALESPSRTCTMSYALGLRWSASCKRTREMMTPAIKAELAARGWVDDPDIDMLALSYAQGIAAGIGATLEPLVGHHPGGWAHKAWDMLQEVDRASLASVDIAGDVSDLRLRVEWPSALVDEASTNSWDHDVVQVQAGSSAGLHCNHDQHLRDGGCLEKLNLTRTTTAQPSHEDDWRQILPALTEAAVLLGWRLYRGVWWCPTHVVAKNLACARCLSVCPACSCVGGPRGDAVEGDVVETTEVKPP